MMAALRKNKEFIIHLRKSKTNLRKSNLKRSKGVNGSMPSKFQTPLTLIMDSVADGEVKEIFKNNLYRSKSTISMDLSHDSEESE